MPDTIPAIPGQPVDVNCALGNWPFRRLALREPEALCRHLASEGIGTAMVSSIDAVFHSDPGEANGILLARLADEQAVYPVPIVNPCVRNWSSSLDSYLDHARVRTVKLHPNYHGYRLDTDCVRELAEILESRDIPLMIAMRMEDERLHHPQMQVPGVPARDIHTFAEQHPALRVVVLNAYRGELSEWQHLGNVFVDIAFVEAWKTLADLCAVLPPCRVLFGSHTPLFETRAATMKLAWAELDGATKTAIAGNNARELFGLRKDTP